MAEDNEAASDSHLPPEAKKSSGYSVWHGLRIRIGHSDDEGSADVDLAGTDEDITINGFEDMFEALGVKIETSEIAKWLDSDVNDSGVQIFTEDEICEIVSQDETAEAEDDEDKEEDEEEPCPVSNSDAARMFEWCLTWLESQPEATVYTTTVLRELQAMATKKRMKSLKQAKLSQYFE